MEPRIISYKVLWEVDQFHSKANSIVSEARERLGSLDFDLAVRRSQEATELHIKTIFRFIGKEYPRSHDLEKVIYEIARLLAAYGISRGEVARMVLANATLNVWRPPSFYGDEQLGVAKVFKQKEAELAVAYAEEVGMICGKIRAELYRRATS